MQHKQEQPVIQRLIQDIEIEYLTQNGIELDEWKMNLMVVSEEHKCMIIAVDEKIHVYHFDF